MIIELHDLLANWKKKILFVPRSLEGIGEPCGMSVDFFSVICDCHEIWFWNWSQNCCLNSLENCSRKIVNIIQYLHNWLWNLKLLIVRSLADDSFFKTFNPFRFGAFQQHALVVIFQIDQSTKVHRRFNKCCDLAMDLFVIFSSAELFEFHVYRACNTISMKLFLWENSNNSLEENLLSKILMMLATVNNRLLFTISSVLYFELLFMKLIDDSSSEMFAVYTKQQHAMHSLKGEVCVWWLNGREILVYSRTNEDFHQVISKALKSSVWFAKWKWAVESQQPESRRCCLLDWELFSQCLHHLVEKKKSGISLLCLISELKMSQASRKATKRTESHHTLLSDTSYVLKMLSDYTSDILIIVQLLIFFFRRELGWIKEANNEFFSTAIRPESLK